jgi:membrane protein
VDPKRLIERADDAQSRRSWTALPVAVAKKFIDDRAGRLAAVIAYYGFVSVFPLLLVFVSVLGFVLRGNADLQRRLLASALATFPIVGTQIGQSVHGATGSPFGVAVGLGLAFWSGLAVVGATQDALNDVWDVARDARPSLVQRVARGTLMLVSFGVVLGASSVLAAAGSSGGWLSPALKPLSLAGSLGLNIALFVVVYDVLTAAAVRARTHVPGAITAGLAWTLLLAIGSWFVDRQIRGATGAYGVFAVVLGLLVWIHLGAQVLLAGAEVNVVRARRLWPRSFMDPSARSADRRSRAARANDRHAGPDEVVEVRTNEPAGRTRGTARRRG